MTFNLSTHSITNSTENVSRVLALTIMCGLDTIAFWANISIFVVVLKNPQLRQTSTNLFLVNLCVVDFLSSIIVLPLSIVTYMERQWIMGETFCMVKGFLSCLFTFVSTTTLCVISIERYYSIKSPMHHAVNLTLCKTGLAILSVWLYSGLFASLPLFGWNRYEYSKNRVQCSFTWETDIYNRLFIIIVVIIYFAIPGGVLFAMYCGIYRVAKHASLQVNPISHSSNGIATDITGRVSVSSHPMSHGTITSSSSPSIVINSSRTNKAPLKAVKTLMMILCTYIVLWGPYFIFHLYGATADLSLPISAVNVSFQWMGYASFALNPFLYGVMNRTIRHELLRLFKAIVCGKKPTRVQDAVEADGQNCNEDFYQFLERTSVLHNNKFQVCGPDADREDLHTVSEMTGEKF